jgi:hypothetical protein
MVKKLTNNAALHDDLMQEALTHLWQEESRMPGQTQSWYIQSCKFHLQHYHIISRPVAASTRANGARDKSKSTIRRKTVNS